jgi:hypothetical protein
LKRPRGASAASKPRTSGLGSRREPEDVAVLVEQGGERERPGHAVAPHASLPVERVDRFEVLPGAQRRLGLLRTLRDNGLTFSPASSDDAAEAVRPHYRRMRRT